MFGKLSFSDVVNSSTLFLVLFVLLLGTAAQQVVLDDNLRLLVKQKGQTLNGKLLVLIDERMADYIMFFVDVEKNYLFSLQDCQNLNFFKKTRNSVFLTGKRYQCVSSTDGYGCDSFSVLWDHDRIGHIEYKNKKLVFNDTGVKKHFIYDIKSNLDVYKVTDPLANLYPKSCRQDAASVQDKIYNKKKKLETCLYVGGFKDQIRKALERSLHYLIRSSKKEMYANRFIPLINCTYEKKRTRVHTYLLSLENVQVAVENGGLLCHDQNDINAYQDGIAFALPMHVNLDNAFSLKYTYSALIYTFDILSQDTNDLNSQKNTDGHLDESFLQHISRDFQLEIDSNRFEKSPSPFKFEYCDWHVLVSD